MMLMDYLKNEIDKAVKDIDDHITHLEKEREHATIPAEESVQAMLKKVKHWINTWYRKYGHKTTFMARIKISKLEETVKIKEGIANDYDGIVSTLMAQMRLGPVSIADYDAYMNALTEIRNKRK